MLFSRILKGRGYRVREAENGRTGLDSVADIAPDLVLLDYKMPVLDGRGFLEGLRASGQAVPVILVTASPEALALGEEFACAGVVLKPPSISTLTAAVERALGRDEVS